MNAEHPIEDIKASILFWTKFINCFASKDKLSQEYSIILIGNQIDKINSTKKSELENCFKKFTATPNQLVSKYCLISGIELMNV